MYNIYDKLAYSVKMQQTNDLVRDLGRLMINYVF